MTRTYLKDLSPEEVIAKLNNGEVVYTEDSKGKGFSYKMIDGVLVAFDESKDTVSGYNRSLYVTDKAYFEDDHTNIKVKQGHWYRTRDEQAVYIYEDIGDNVVYRFKGCRIGSQKYLTWSSSGIYDITEPNHHLDLVEEIIEDEDD